MIRIGVDPGLSPCAFSVVDLSSQRPMVLEVASARTSAKSKFVDRVAEIRSVFVDLVERHDPIDVVMESQDGALAMAQAQGRSSFNAARVLHVVQLIRDECLHREIALVEKTPQQIGSALSIPRGLDRMERKRRIRSAVLTLCDFCEKMRLSQHTSDAIATAIAVMRSNDTTNHKA